MKQSQEFADNVFKNFNELFFNPEIEKRRQRNEIQEPFYLIAAQVVFFGNGKQPIVRINSEVRAEVKIKKNVDITKNDFWASRNEVDKIIFNDSENLDCGHATMILFKDGYRLSFDFIYNKNTCGKYLKTAEEFLKTAKFALENNYISAFIDNSFSSMELLAKCKLLLETNENMKGKTNHKAIKSEFNKRFKNDLNIIEIDYKIVFNKLSQLRNDARYLENTFSVSENEKKLIVDSMSDLFEKIKENIS
jgi:uncharacterized protein (UPF0332 family)